MTDGPKIPVWPTATDSWRLTGRYWRQLLLAGLAPAAIVLGTDVILLPALPVDEATIPGALTAVILRALPMALLLVPVHRLILLGEIPPVGIAALRARARHDVFLKRFVLLDLVAFAVLAIFEWLSNLPAPIALIAIPAFLVALTYVLSRLSLALPAAAVGDDDTFRRAWNITSGNGWRITGATLLADVPIFVAAISIALLTDDGTYVAERTPISAAILLSVAEVVGVVVGAAALSICYGIVNSGGELTSA